MIFTIDSPSFLKVSDEQNTLCIPICGGQNLAYWCLRLWLLWTVFTCCCPLSWLLIWLWSQVVDLCFIHCHIFMQKLLFVALKQLQTMLWITLHIVVFDWLWANVAPTLNTAFSLTNIHAKWWIQCLLISSTPLLSHTTSIYDQPKQVCWVFWCFPG